MTRMASAVALGLALAGLGTGGGRALAASAWGADYFPNVILTTQDGKKVRFFDDLIKDKVVSINFIFTNCPDSCPLETAGLREVQRILGDRVGQDIFFYSITIDPDRDTPAVLKRYAETFQVGPGWTFLTGKKADINLLRTRLGLLARSREADPLKRHSLTMIIGNQATGQWMKGSPFENPYVLATQLGSWLHNWKQPPDPKQNYASAPEVRTLSKGETLFRTRCAVCHTIGETGETVRQPLGPDLMNVTARRDRAWLSRWMAEPDRMLADQDPQAMAMFAAYHNLSMPNLRLNAGEIQALISYLEEESRRVAHQQHAPAVLQTSAAR